MWSADKWTKIERIAPAFVVALEIWNLWHLWEVESVVFIGPRLG